MTFGRRREARTRGLAAVFALSAGLAGCSMPIPGFIDAAPTGALKSTTYPFAKEDWSKAEPAVLAAIRADAADDPAPWNNADSGRRGLVAGVGARFERAGATCRAFVAKISDNGESRSMQGDACEKAGEVTLSDTAPLRGV